MPKKGKKPQEFKNYQKVWPEGKQVHDALLERCALKHLSETLPKGSIGEQAKKEQKLSAKSCFAIFLINYYPQPIPWGLRIENAKSLGLSPLGYC